MRRIRRRYPGNGRPDSAPGGPPADLSTDASLEISSRGREEQTKTFQSFASNGSYQGAGYHTKQRTSARQPPVSGRATIRHAHLANTIWLSESACHHLSFRKLLKKCQVRSAVRVSVRGSSHSLPP